MLKLKSKFRIVNGCLYDDRGKIYIKNIKILDFISNDGANAVIFRAYDKFLRREIVLKVWCRIDKRLKDRVRKSKEECIKMSKLKHSNVVAIHFADIVNNYPIAIFDLLNGLTLYEWLKNSPSFLDRYKIWSQISDTLEYCHNQGVIHGDLHNKNIVVENGKAILIDFGTSFFTHKTNYFKRASKCLVKLGNELFYDLPFSTIIHPVDNPESIRAGIYSAVSIFYKVNQLKERLTKFLDKEGLDPLYYYKETAISIVCDMIEAPILKFDKIEKIIQKLSFLNIDYKKEDISKIFYGHLFSMCKQRAENLYRVDVSFDVNRKSAEQIYKKWSAHYMENLSLTVDK